MKLKRSRFHTSTIVILLFSAGAMFCINLVPHDEFLGSWKGVCRGYGWPWHWRQECNVAMFAFSWNVRNLAIDILVALLPLFAIALLSELVFHTHFQIEVGEIPGRVRMHLSTYALMSMLSGVLLLANMQTRLEYRSAAFSNAAYNAQVQGWPIWFRERAVPIEYRYKNMVDAYSNAGLAADILIALAVLTMAALICEWAIRPKDRS